MNYGNKAVRRLKIIGGVFGRATIDSVGTEPISLHLLPHLRRIDLAAARCAIRLLATRREIDRVWVPSYVCESVLNAIPSAKRIFYSIGRDWRGVPEGIGRKDLFLSIVYFGRAHDESALEFARAQGAITVLDATACVPEHSISTGADFVIYSPHKVMGVPDGGILLDRTGALALPVHFPPAPRAWRDLALACFELRSTFDAGDGSDDERPWLEFQRRWETEFPPGIWAMPHATGELLESSPPLREMRARRRANHDILAAMLPFVPEAAGADAPLGYVIVFENETLRERIRRALMAERIYPAVHWPLPAAVRGRFVESGALSRKILTIPCDQRYGEDDLERTAEVICRELKLEKDTSPCDLQKLKVPAGNFAARRAGSPV